MKNIWGIGIISDKEDVQSFAETLMEYIEDGKKLCYAIGPDTLENRESSCDIMLKEKGKTL